MVKQFLFPLLILLFFASCSKDKNTEEVSVYGSIEYKVNGSLVTMENSDVFNGESVGIDKRLWSSLRYPARYIMNARKGSNNLFSITITTDSLLKKSYHTDSATAWANGVNSFGGLMFDDHHSGIYFPGDVFDIKITSYSNGRVSGSFSGKFTPFGPVVNVPDPNNKGSIIIADGKLNNVPVTY